MSQNQMTENQPRVRQISLKHLFFFLLKRWRSLVAVILVGALLGGAYGFYKDSKAKDPYDPYAKGREADGVQMRELERIYRNYQLVNEDADHDYRVQLSEDLQYYTGTLNAYVDAEDDLTASLLGQLLDIRKDESYLDALAEIVGLSPDMDRSSLAPILSYVYTLNDKSGSAVSVYVGQEADPDGNYGVLTYTVHYVTSDQFDRVIAYVKEHLNKLNAEYQEGSAYRFEILGVTKNEETRSTTFARRNEAARTSINNLNSFLTVLETAEKTTSPYNGAELGKYFRKHVMASGNKDTSDASSLKKMIVLGVFGMIVLWGVYWVLAYLVRDRIYTRGSLSVEYGLFVLGMAGSEPPKNPIDRFLAKWEGQGQINSPEYLADSLAALKGDPIVLCRISQEKADEELAEVLLAKNESLWAADVTRDAELFTKAGEDTAVVFLVHLGVTRSQELTNAIQVCRLHGYRILGAVLMAE